MRSLATGAGVWFAVAGFAVDARAQTGTITGTVTDAQTGDVLPGVNVIVTGLERAGIGAATDTDGAFTIERVPAGTHTVEARFIGYEPAARQVAVRAGESVAVDFALRASLVDLDELVVTGTATGARKRSLGNTVTRIDVAEVTELAQVEDPSQLLNGRTPGAVVLSGSGMVGSGPRITIRGRSSLSLRGQPLLYVDGARVDNAVATGPAGSSSYKVFSRLNDFHPHDIQSLEVIKGPAAATLYGTEASKGVIQILTRRGEAGENRVQFTTSHGANWLQDPGGKFPTNYWRNPDTGEINAVNLFEREVDLGNDPFGTGYAQSYGLSTSGGSEAVQYCRRHHQRLAWPRRPPRVQQRRPRGDHGAAPLRTPRRALPRVASLRRPAPVRAGRHPAGR